MSSTKHIPGKIVRVFTTYNTSLLLTDEGKLYGAGDSNYGANGLIVEADKSVWTLVPNLQDEFVTDVRAGLFFVALFTRSSNIYVFGLFNKNQFGVSPNYSVPLNRGPTLMDSFHDMNNISEISTGSYNSIVLTSMLTLPLNTFTHYEYHH